MTDSSHARAATQARIAAVMGVAVLAIGCCVTSALSLRQFSWLGFVIVAVVCAGFGASAASSFTKYNAKRPIQPGFLTRWVCAAITAGIGGTIFGAVAGVTSLVAALVSLGWTLGWYGTSELWADFGPRRRPATPERTGKI